MGERSERGGGSRSAGDRGQARQSLGHTLEELAASLEHAQEAAVAETERRVFLIAGERMGEALAAYVSPRPGAELDSRDLIAFARSRIAGYKVPYAIEILPELPLLPSGKPDRKALSR